MTLTLGRFVTLSFVCHCTHRLTRSLMPVHSSPCQSNYDSFSHSQLIAVHHIFTHRLPFIYFISDSFFLPFFYAFALYTSIQSYCYWFTTSQCSSPTILDGLTGSSQPRATMLPVEHAVCL